MADIGAQINAAYAALPPEGGIIKVDSNGTFSTPIVFAVSNKVATLEGAGNGTTLTYTGSGTAITFNNGILFDLASGFRDITLSGPGSGSATIGILFGGTNGAVGLSGRNFKIQGFGVGLQSDSRTWITKFTQGMIRDCGTLVLMPNGLTAGGENVEFDHCTFADAPAPHTSAVWIQGDGQEVTFSACSFDQAQLHIGSGATSAAHVTVTSCHFENPNWSVGGSVDYSFIDVDQHQANYVKITDCYIEQDRNTGGAYSRFFNLKGGVVNIMGLGMFTPVALTNLAVLANDVNINLFAFNDLSGNISGGLFGGTTTGFLNSFPGTSTALTTGFNTILGPGSITGAAAINFLVDMTLGLNAQNVIFTVHSVININDLVTDAPVFNFNTSGGNTGKMSSGATDAFLFQDQAGTHCLEIRQTGVVLINSRDVLAELDALEAIAGFGGYHPLVPSGGNVTIDYNDGISFELTLDGTAFTFLPPIFTGGAFSNTQTYRVTVYLNQDATGARVGPTWSNSAGGFVSNTGSQISIDGTASTQTSIQFTRQPSGFWAMDWSNTGKALS